MHAVLGILTIVAVLTCAGEARRHTLQTVWDGVYTKVAPGVFEHTRRSDSRFITPASQLLSNADHASQGVFGQPLLRPSFTIAISRRRVIQDPHGPGQ
jgi:hypothetical protein